MTIKTKSSLVRKYEDKRDQLISEFSERYNRRSQLKRKGVTIVKPPENTNTLCWCPNCMRIRDMVRMFQNKDGHWQCPGCNNIIDPSDLGLKPYSEDEIVAQNDPYRPEPKIYTPSRNLLKQIGTSNDLKHKPEGVYPMTGFQRFESVAAVTEAMTAGLNPPQNGNRGNRLYRSANL